MPDFMLCQVEAAEVWPGHVIAPHLGALWQTVRADLLPPRDLQTAEVALKALQAIIRTSNEPYLSPVLTSVMSCKSYSINLFNIVFYLCFSPVNLIFGSILR